MSAARRLVVLPVSPWSERAKWALDHHRLTYEVIEHLPFLGERRLRKLVGPSKSQATVPVLLVDHRVLTESWDIALYADREGGGAKLIPAEREDEIKKWNALADETMHASRALVVFAMLASNAALGEGLPPMTPRPLRPLFVPVARYGTRWFAKKYGLKQEDAPAHQQKLRESFAKVRSALAKNNAPYLLESFSYADVLMATCLQGVVPVGDRWFPLGPATRAAWTSPELAKDHADLLAWRDRLYAEHRAK